MSYEPLGEEPFDGEQIPVKPRRRRPKKSRSAGGPGRSVAIVFLVLLVVAIVAVAITVPIVMTRRTQQPAASDPNNRNGGNGRSASSSSSSNGASQDPSTAPSQTGAPGFAAELNQADPLNDPNDPAPGALVDNPAAGFGAVDPVGPNRNTGADVFCYKSADGSTMQGAFRLTGEVSTSDGLHRSQVKSCGSGSKMFVLTSQLSKCSSECLTPVWMAVQDGIVKPPIWKEQYVCRGDQVYLNRNVETQTPRYTFYWRYAGFVEEQLITRCDSNEGWYVPNGELRYCTPKEKVDCQMAVLNGHEDVTEETPKILEGVPAGTASNPRPVCVERDGEIRAFYATGPASNLWAWSKFRFADEVEVVPCSNHSAPTHWVMVDDITVCPAGMSSACDQGHSPVISA